MSYRNGQKGHTQVNIDFDVGTISVEVKTTVKVRLCLWQSLRYVKVILCLWLCPMMCQDKTFCVCLYVL